LIINMMYTFVKLLLWRRSSWSTKSSVGPDEVLWSMDVTVGNSVAPEFD